jgi:hypothetical protein
MYAANMTQEIYEAQWQCNKEAVEVNVKLLAEVKVDREVQFVHVKGHSGDKGNDAADARVQWGKDVSNPMCRLRKGGGEGDGRFGPAERVIIRPLEHDDSQRGEKDGEELGGVAAAGSIEPAAEPTAEGVASSPEGVSDEEEGELQKEPAADGAGEEMTQAPVGPLLLPRTLAAAGAGPTSLAGIFQRISAEVCENC